MIFSARHYKNIQRMTTWRTADKRIYSGTGDKMKKPVEKKVDEDGESHDARIHPARLSGGESGITGRAGNWKLPWLAGICLLTLVPPPPARAWDSPPSVYYSPSTSYQSYYPSPPSFYGGYGGYGQGSSSPIISFDLNEQDLLDSSLRIAAREARISDIREALRKGGKINSASREGTTALMYASQNCFPEVVEYLLRHGGNPSHKDRRGRTALMLAAHDACLPVVRILLKHGHCEPYARDRAGQSAYDMAESAGELDVDGPAIEIMGLLRSHRPASAGALSASREGHPTPRKSMD